MLNGRNSRPVLTGIISIVLMVIKPVADFPVLVTDEFL